MSPYADPPWKPIAVAAWALLAAAFAWRFAPLLAGSFLADDFVPLVLFEQWRGEGRLLARLLSNFWSPFETSHHFYRPLGYVALAVQDAVSGADPRGWMAVTIGLHFANGILVAGVALASPHERPDARAVAAAALGAALFLALAPTVEVAAWISARFDALATFFTLAAVLAYLRSRRAWDRAWWISLAAMAGACVAKESAALVPFAILLHARFVRAAGVRGTAGWIAALRASWPWLALAALYLAARWAMFGSATSVYKETRGIGVSFATFLGMQFAPAHRATLAAILAAVQVALAFLSRPIDARARGALVAAAASGTVAVLLLLPSAFFPDNGSGGRLLYQAAAFYGVFTAIAVRHTRLPYLAFGVAAGLVVVHATLQAGALRRWELAHSQMRALVGEIHRVDRETPADGFALVLVPAWMQGVPFGVNAQAGLMLPPLFPPRTAHHLLVQLHEEVRDLPGKIREGLVPSLRRYSVAEYMEGKRAPAGPLVYPTRVLCWDSKRAALVPLQGRASVPPASPEAWAEDVQASLRPSGCAALRFSA